MTKRFASRLPALTIICLIAALYNTTLFAAPAAPFDLPTSQGTVSLSQLKGKVVYVDFWASWCVPCRKSFPWMNDMQKRYGEAGLVVVAINLDADQDLVKKFLNKYPANFTIAYDPEGETAASYEVRGMPSSYLIGRDGQLVSSHVGFRQKDTAEMEEKIRQLLKK